MKNKPTSNYPLHQPHLPYPLLTLLKSVFLLSLLNLTLSQTLEIPLHKFTDRRSLYNTNEDFKVTPSNIPKGRGLQQIDIEMTNFLNYQYYASIYMGDIQRNMTFIWDTGSVTLWVPLSNCSSCPSTNKYTPGSSYVGTGTASGINYALGSVNGTLADDDVRITPGGTSARMRILGVDNADDDIQGLRADGIMGMGPVSSGARGDLFVEKLHEAGVIGQNTFGVDYKNFSETSTITLGGFDTSIVPSEESFSWIDLYATSHWTVELSDAKYGETDISLRAITGILDTGTSLTLFETQDFDTIWNEISSGKTCGYSTGTGLRACYCDSASDFSDITFDLGTVRVSLPTDGYVVLKDNASGPDLCEFWIDSINVNLGDPYVLLGDSFLRQYYVYHDPENRRVGLFGSVQSSNASTFSSLATLCMSSLFCYFML